MLVSHGFVTKAILADAMGMDIEQWGDIDIPTASISLLEYDQEDKVTVVYTGEMPMFPSLRSNTAPPYAA